MASNGPRRIPLAGTTADEFFVRQRDDFSCGPACMTTLAHIYGIDAGYEFYREQAKPNPLVGTPAVRMAELCGNLLPFEQVGLDSYKGGIAIANVIQGEDHYVVFLKKDGDEVIYYDPYEHELVIDELKNVAWLSEKGDHDRWCIDFAPVAGNSFEKWIAMALPKPPVQPRHAPPPAP